MEKQLADLKEILKNKEAMAKIREIDTPEKFKELLKKGNIDLGKMPLEEAYRQFRKIAEIDPNAPVTEMSDEELEATTGGVAPLVLALIPIGMLGIGIFGGIHTAKKMK